MGGRRSREGCSCWPNVVETSALFFSRWHGSIKSLQRDAIVGRWDGHALNLGGVGRMAAEHVACSSVRAAGVILIFDPSAKF